MNVKFYHLSTCDTCKRIIKSLSLPETTQIHDLKNNPISSDDLDELHQKVGTYAELFNKRSRQFRALGLHEQNLSEDQIRNYLLQEYTFLKRPIFIVDGEPFVGNSKKVVEALAEKLNK